MIARGSDPNEWSLDNRRSFSEFVGQPGTALIDGAAWGGAFWEIRQRLEPEPVDRLLYRAWLESSAAEIDQGNGLGFVNKLADSAWMCWADKVR